MDNEVVGSAVVLGTWYLSRRAQWGGKHVIRWRLSGRILIRWLFPSIDDQLQLTQPPRSRFRIVRSTGCSLARPPTPHPLPWLSSLVLIILLLFRNVSTSTRPTHEPSASGSTLIGDHQLAVEILVDISRRTCAHRYIRKYGRVRLASSVLSDVIAFEAIRCTCCSFDSTRIRSSHAPSQHWASTPDR